MQSVTKNIMKSLKTITAIVAFAILFAGCKTFIAIPFVEHDSPLGCDKANDRYFDFIDTQKCVRPTTWEQLYVLDRFRYLSQYAEDNPEEVIKVRVGFHDYIDTEAYEQLIVNEEKILEITEVYLFYPLLDDNGLGGPVSSWEQNPIARNDMVRVGHQKDVEIYSSMFYNVVEQTDPLYDREDMETYVIKYVTVSMKASEIPQWWQENKAQVRYIQTMISDLDPMQTAFRPGHPIIPPDKETPEIDWENEQQQQETR